MIFSFNLIGTLWSKKYSWSNFSLHLPYSYPIIHTLFKISLIIMNYWSKILKYLTFWYLLTIVYYYFLISVSTFIKLTFHVSMCSVLVIYNWNTLILEWFSKFLTWYYLPFWFHQLKLYHLPKTYTEWLSQPEPIFEFLYWGRKLDKCPK